MEQCDIMDRYLNAYNLDKTVQWHEVRANPKDYMTLGEQLDYLNKFKKMSDKELGEELLNVTTERVVVATADLLINGAKISDKLVVMTLSILSAVDSLRKLKGTIRTRLLGTHLADELIWRFKVTVPKNAN